MPHFYLCNFSEKMKIELHEILSVNYFTIFTAYTLWPALILLAGHVKFHARRFIKYLVNSCYSLCLLLYFL